MNIRVKISSRSANGFYRFGQKFPPKGKEVELTAEQLEVAKTDPNLFVEVVVQPLTEATDEDLKNIPSEKWKNADLVEYLKTEFGFEFPEGTTPKKAELLDKIAELQNADPIQQDGAE